MEWLAIRILLLEKLYSILPFRVHLDIYKEVEMLLLIIQLCNSNLLKKCTCIQIYRCSKSLSFDSLGFRSSNISFPELSL
jgi:hypothetical protein